jgi:hypothetical protein
VKEDGEWRMDFFQHTFVVFVLYPKAYISTEGKIEMTMNVSYNRAWIVSALKGRQNT